MRDIRTRQCSSPKIYKESILDIQPLSYLVRLQPGATDLGLMFRHKPDCAATSTGQMQRECVTSPNVLLANRHVLWILFSISSVFVNFCRVSPAPQKAQWNTQIAGCPVGHTSQIPFGAVLPCDRY